MGKLKSILDMARAGGAKKAIDIARSDGFLHSLKAVLVQVQRAFEQQSLNVEKKYDFVCIPQFEDECSLPLNEEKQIIWYIPDFGIGSGGHNTIFRFISMLEKHGLKSDLFICENSQWSSPETVKKIINKHFYPIDVDVFIGSPATLNQFRKSYSVGIATSWKTAYFLRGSNSVKNKCYFVQDYEPYFYPRGSDYSLAENTYKFGFRGITAGTWLLDRLKNDFGMDCISFDFGYEKLISKKKTIGKGRNKRLLFYARPPTERRGFEVGILALKKVMEARRNIEVLMLGWDVSNYDISFPFQNLGVVPADELSDIYATCDIGLVISYTNISLLPMELLAAGCEVVINKGDNNYWGDNGLGGFHYSDPDPDSIAAKLINVIDGKISAIKGEDRVSFLQDKSWEKEGGKVANFVRSLC